MSYLRGYYMNELDKEIENAETSKDIIESFLEDKEGFNQSIIDIEEETNAIGLNDSVKEKLSKKFSTLTDDEKHFIHNLSAIHIIKTGIDCVNQKLDLIDRRELRDLFKRLP